VRALIDTNVLLRWYWSAEAVSVAARAVIEEPDNEIVVSVISLYEIGNKNRLGKLAVRVSDIELAAEDDGFTFLAIDRRHARRAATLPWDHRDPWDRLIAAQAMEEGLPLLSTDAAFDAAGVKRIW
jgi:PIN domain nuclease of toxin-antitoxin system